MPTPDRWESALVAAASADAESLFLNLFADHPAAFWLDAGAEAAQGWSILGCGEIEADADAVRAVDVSAPGDGPGDRERPPFGGGWVGWLSYEDGAAALGAPAAVSGAASRWIAASRAVAVDHARGRVYALAGPGELRSWAQRVQRAVDDAEASEPDAALPVIAQARHGVDAYAELIQRCRAAIERGDAYQLCLTNRFTTARPDDPFAVYRRLRRATPAHHGGYLRMGDEHLLSASPEQFLAVSGGVVTTSPIKGTRPRGATAEQDAVLAAELQADVKERAENVMIVDLMRNDLSHVGVPGSVVVDRLWHVESYPAVHQLVSTVRARLREGVTAGELCDATFPAGSMTGAPKLSAMTVLHELEGAARGVYSGCFGYVGLDGRVDLAMVIRSIVVDGERAYVGAGGGITWLSKPDAETAEVATKARAPLAALGAAVPPEWAALGD